MVGDFLRKIL